MSSDEWATVIETAQYRDYAVHAIVDLDADGRRTTPCGLSEALQFWAGQGSQVTCRFCLAHAPTALRPSVQPK